MGVGGAQIIICVSGGGGHGIKVGNDCSNPSLRELPSCRPQFPSVLCFYTYLPVIIKWP